MDATAAPRREFEVLDRVGDVDPPPVDAGLFQRHVQQLSRWPDERPADDVLLIARLLADEHDLGVVRSFTEHGLRRRPSTARNVRTRASLGEMPVALVWLACQHHGAERRSIQRARNLVENFSASGRPSPSLAGQDRLLMRIPPRK